MKKMYIFSAALLAATTTLGQDSNDSLTFESVNLAPASYYNGSDGMGQIQIGDITLSNSYDDSWGSWSGFSVSNVIDVTTAGYGNQYASYAGGGANSDNYGVFYYDGSITFDQDMVVHSAQFTNTTYAGLSMLNGDSYSKQFGSPNGADGNPDGTNGEDYFLLQIVALDAMDMPVADTFDVYLADYRFADDNDDYILNTWETVDFSANEVLVARKLKFLLSSTDNGDFGMNTPAYFAIDNLVVGSNVGVNTPQLALGTYPNPFESTIRVQCTETVDIQITNGAGSVVYTDHFSGEKQLNLSDLPAGVYFLNAKSSTSQTTQKIVKY